MRKAYELPSDSPYSSPSYSPFEPDHNLFASYTLQQPPSIHRLLHPGLAAFRIPHALDAQAPKILDRTEHRPRRATRSTSSPPRTRSSSFDGSAARIATSSRSQQEDQPAQWKSLPAEDRKNWENLAKEKKRRSRYQEASLPVVHRLYPQAASEDTVPLAASTGYRVHLTLPLRWPRASSTPILSRWSICRTSSTKLNQPPQLRSCSSPTSPLATIASSRPSNVYLPSSGSILRLIKSPPRPQGSPTPSIPRCSLPTTSSRWARSIRSTPIFRHRRWSSSFPRSCTTRADAAGLSQYSW